MTIKAWVSPPQSLALSELVAEFGCEPLLLLTTTTTLPPETTSTTTTTTTTTSTTTTTLPPNQYNPFITLVGYTAQAKVGTNNTYQIPIFYKGPAYQISITGAPPGATFSMLIVNGTSTSTLAGTIPVNGTYITAPDISTNLVAGLLNVTIYFTPLVGQVVQFSSERILEVAISEPTTTTSTTTTQGPSTYSFKFYNENTGNEIISANEGDLIRITLVTTNVPYGTILPYTIAGVSSADFVASPLLSGTFAVGAGTSAVFELSNDFLTEGTESLIVYLGYTQPYIASGSLAIQDTSVVQFGTAILTTTSGQIETLTGSATLPSVPVTVLFRLIGAGGSGGTPDQYGPGSNGGGGGVVLGVVKLPETNGNKVLRGGVGLPGLSASSRYAGNNLPNPFGEGGQGFSFPTSGYSSRGGNGALGGPYGVSGNGGGGGGATALIYTVINQNIAIASAGGGGGGSGGSLRTGSTAASNNSNPTPISAFTIQNLNGGDVERPYHDGGGGGGGGANLGESGTNGYDRGTYSTGGRAGRPVQNYQAGNWVKFEYVQAGGMSVNAAISGNKNYYGNGGSATDFHTPSQSGNPGAIAVFWTTNPNQQWDPDLIPPL